MGVTNRYSEKEFSQKASFLSFGAILAVMFIHSSDIVPEFALTWKGALIHFVGTSLTSWAVPFFFTVSGYFFWIKRGDWSDVCGAWKKVLSKKIRTLGVPYLLWCVIGALCISPLIMYSNHVTGRPLVERSIFGANSLIGTLCACFGIDGTPIGNVPLWYVRALISIFLMAPLFVFVIKRMKWVGLLLACTCVFIRPFYEVPFITYQVRGLGYFYFGMMLSDCDCIRKPVSVRNVLLGAVVVLVLLIDDMTMRICTVFLPVALMFLLWGCYDVFSWPRNVAEVPWSVRQTFWIYCLHMIPTGYLLAIGRLCLGKTDVAAVLFMFVIPPIALLFSLLCGFVINKYCPVAYCALTGGRGTKYSEKKRVEL